jgi:hypothetical protein
MPMVYGVRLQSPVSSLQRTENISTDYRPSNFYIIILSSISRALAPLPPHPHPTCILHVQMYRVLSLLLSTHYTYTWWAGQRRATGRPPSAAPPCSRLLVLPRFSCEDQRALISSRLSHPPSPST